MNHPPLRFLRRPEVESRTGLARTTIYMMERAGKFPNRHTLSPRCVAWLESDVDQWIRERAAAGAGRNSA